jgi:uncharacterized protein (DUF2147 family)
MVKHAWIMVLMVASANAFAQSASLIGDWQEPEGSIIRIQRCGNELCMKLQTLRRNPPATMDIHNSNTSLRTRALCGLQIGSGFHMDDATHASGGELYDPRSGYTYHGKITLEGDELKLRGYIGTPLFGRTEEWRRVQASDAPCMSAPAK